MEICMQVLSLTGCSLHVDFLPLGVCVPCVADLLVELLCVSGVSDKVVSSKELVLGWDVGRRVFTHGPGLGVVMRRRHVKVTQVFGRVLTDTQVSDCSRGASTRGPDSLGHFTKVSHVLFCYLLIVLLLSLVFVRVAVLSLFLARMLLLFAEFLLKLLLLLQLGLELLHLLKPVHDLGVLAGVVPVPAVPLTLKVQLDGGNLVVRSDVHSGPTSALLAGSLQAVIAFVCHRPTIFAGSFSELVRLEHFGSAVVPLLGRRFLRVPVLLMLQPRMVTVQIPRRGRHVLWNMWINFFSILIDFRRRETSLSGFF
mmetsp:Transcript_9499/g.12886  ORF Transcript_9499/g.12886 Transcript_9499/m.12886 type:complete len:311 (-) Transcript_9499:111-1043(-)